MSANAAHFDDNQTPTIMGVIGTLGTADTGGTAKPLPFAIDPATGAIYVNLLQGSINIGTIAEDLTVTAGTITRISTIGTLEVGTINAGTTTETRPAISTLTNVVGTNVNINLLAVNTARRGAYFFNEGTTVCSVKLGTTATAGSFTVQMSGTSLYELPTPVYSGIVDGIWTVSTGTMHVTEVT